jgi:hypothetical protein
MSKDWKSLVEVRKAVPHETSAGELGDLRSIIERDLEDASLEILSDDRRFATAYNAALQLSKMVVVCSGYRIIGQGHHQTTFEALEFVEGFNATKYSLYFDSCRRKRNAVDYDLTGVASRTEVDELMSVCVSFQKEVEEWILAYYPDLA